MLINEEPEWTGFTDDDFPMFPELGTLEDEGSMPADDFLEALSSSLEIPMLLNGEGSPGCYDDESPDEIMKAALETQTMRSLDDIDLGFASGGSGTDDRSDDFPDFFSVDEKPPQIKNVKMEPNSPATQLPPSPSPSQSDSGSNSGSEWQSETSSVTNSDVKFALETPPISPPQNESPPISPKPAQNNPSLLQPIKLLPLNSLNLKDGSAQKFVLSDGNPAKRICIQPKLEKSTKDTPRKTIVLSAQDFAALTQRVKQNTSNQPLKVQALPMSKHIKIQNQLNLTPVQQAKPTAANTTAPTAAPQNNQVKIINAIPNVQIHTKNPVITIPNNAVVKAEAKPAVSMVVQKEQTTGPSIVIKNDVPVCPPIVIKKETPNSCPPIVVKNEFPEFIEIHDRYDSEIKALKRQQRMIKNRESACLSRKKKKEYVTSLENRISDLEDRNQQLETENVELKKRLSAYEDISEKKFGSHHFGVNKKNTAILLAMVFMVSLNVGSFGGVFNQNRQPLGDLRPHVPSIALPNVRHSRTLLWSNSEDQEKEQKDRYNDSTQTHHPMCPMHINRTESIRLDSELRRWIGGDPDRDNWTKPSQTDLEVKSLNELLHLRSHPVRNKATENTLRLSSRRATRRAQTKNSQLNNAPSTSNINAVQVFSPLLREHAKLFDALGRKDDTFYVVWFTGDHLLLPASRKNSTVRPKMSLILPAVPVNGSYYSTPANHVTMMQIDCEVTNTQLLHLQENIIPKHLRTTHQPDDSSKVRSTGVSDATSNTPKNYKPYFLKGNNSTNTLHSDNPKQQYASGSKHAYTEKFNKDGFQMDEMMKYNPYEEKDQKKMKTFTSAAEDLLKNSTFAAQDKRMLMRRKMKRSTLP